MHREIRVIWMTPPFNTKLLSYLLPSTLKILYKSLCLDYFAPLLSARYERDDILYDLYYTHYYLFHFTFKYLKAVQNHCVQKERHFFLEIMIFHACVLACVRSS